MRGEWFMVCEPDSLEPEEDVWMVLGGAIGAFTLGVLAGGCVLTASWAIRLARWLA